MADPIVYGPAFSTYVRGVRLALEEKGAAYRLEEIDILSGANKEAPYIARQPFAKVPAFEHDGFALYESQPIMRYVDAAFDGPALQPGDTRARARMDQALAIVDAYAYPAWITGIVIQRVVVPMMGGEADEAVVEAALANAETSVGVFDGMLGEADFLAGGGLSLADLHLAPIYDYFRATPEGERLLAGKDNLARWWRAMSARDSVVATTPDWG